MLGFQGFISMVCFPNIPPNISKHVHSFIIFGVTRPTLLLNAKLTRLSYHIYHTLAIWLPGETPSDPWPDSSDIPTINHIPSVIWNARCTNVMLWMALFFSRKLAQTRKGSSSRKRKDERLSGKVRPLLSLHIMRSFFSCRHVGIWVFCLKRCLCE